MKNSTRLITLLLLATLLISILSFGVSAASATIEDTETGEEIFTEDDLSGLFGMTKEGARVVLIILAVVLGLVAPTIPLAIFTVKLVKAKKEFEVIDYIILSVTAIWLASGLMIFITVL